MTQVSVYITASLDGYIATPDGGVGWLSDFEGGDEDYGYSEFMARVDAIVMGSTSYEQVLTFGALPYAGQMSYVFTSRELTSDRSDVEFLAGQPSEEIDKLDEQGIDHVWLMGGAALIASFREAVLIDEYIVSTIPILLGDGIPLFSAVDIEEKVELISAKDYPSGLVQTHYLKG